MNNTNTNTNGTGQPRHGSVVGKGWFVLGAMWSLVVICLLFAGMAGYAQINTATAIFVLVTSVGAAVLGFRQAHSIAEAARVSGARAAPSGLWQQWWASSTKQAVSLWVVMALGLAVVMVPTASAWHWLTPVAAMSWVQALSTVLALAMRGFFQRVWLWGLALCGMAWLVVSTLMGGVVSTMQCLDTVPFMVLLALAMAWPVLIAVLTRLWPTAPQLAQSPSAVLTLPGLFQAYRRRYVSISVGGTLSATLLVVAMGFLSNNTVKPAELAWGGTVTGFHLVCQLLLLMLCSRHLVCRDLHWRALLAPGYLQAGGIGTRIVRSSLETSVAIVLAVAVFYLSVEWLQSGFSVASVLDAAKRYGMLPVQLVFAVCIATLIRGAWPDLHWEPAAGAIALAVACVLMVFKILGAGAWTDALFEASYAYVAALLALSAAALGLSNHMWTLPKLAKFAPEV